MSLINPIVEEKLKGIGNLEVKRLIWSTYRYNSKTGKGLPDTLPYERDTGDFIGKNISVLNGDFDDRQSVVAITQLFPEFDKQCLAHLNELPEEDRTVREVFHRFAIYMADNILQMSEEDKDVFFGIIELILKEGTESIKMIVGNSFLEDFQNIFGNQGNNPEQFVLNLNTETKIWWGEINRFWYNLELYYAK